MVQPAHQPSSGGHRIHGRKRLDRGACSNHGARGPDAAGRRHLAALQVMPTVRAATERALLAASPMARHRDTAADRTGSCGHRTYLLELTVPRIGTNDQLRYTFIPFCSDYGVRTRYWTAARRGKFTLRAQLWLRGRSSAQAQPGTPSATRSGCTVAFRVPIA
jgi:hypothetical protein